MAPIESATYTAKLTDGPLEGKTILTEFAEGGEPHARLTIPASTEKKYLYRRTTGLEFTQGRRPTAVDYRYIEVVVD